jgi:hypothetical protein
VPASLPKAARPAQPAWDAGDWQVPAALPKGARTAQPRQNRASPAAAHRYGGRAARQKKRNTGRVAATVCALVVLAGAGSAWLFRDRLFGDTPGIARTEPPASASATAQPSPPADVAGGASGVSGASANAHNASMAGLYAVGGQKIYRNDGASVLDEAGNEIYGEALYFMNADETALYGITSRGEIAAVGTNSDARILRAAGRPASLALDGGTLYFVEDGLCRMDVNGGGEQRLTEYVPGAFAAYGGAVYYIGEDGKLWRSDGTEPTLAVDMAVDGFCLDGERVYFTPMGGGDLYTPAPDGGYRLVTPAMRGLLSPRFAVADGMLYFGESGGGVYALPLGGGEVETIAEDGCIAFYLLPDGVRCVEDALSSHLYALTDQR